MDMSPAFAAPLSRNKKKALSVLCLSSLLCLAVLLTREFKEKSLPFDATAQKAIQQVGLCHDEIYRMRQELGIVLDERLDPARSGLIGEDFTDLTTTLGDLNAKQKSLSPYFAGLIVQWLEQAGVRPGDCVAVNFTGSFPALNIAAHCAFDALEVRPVIFGSVGASSYGANIPGFTWPDMERRLHEKGLIRHASRWLSLGGILDSEGGLDGTGIFEAEAAIRRHGAEYIREGRSSDVVTDVSRRMDLYLAHCQASAYISIGGSVTTLGWVAESALLDTGLLKRIPVCSSENRGLIFRFFERGVPVIHLLNIDRLASEYGIFPSADGHDLQDRTSFQYSRLLKLFILLSAWFLTGVFFTMRGQ